LELHGSLIPTALLISGAYHLLLHQQHLSSIHGIVSNMATTHTHVPIPDQVLHPELLSTPTFTFAGYLARLHPTLGRPSKIARPICAEYKAGNCPRGVLCHDRHYTPPSERSGINNLICKHYQRGLCKKGDACEFAHTFNLRDERECKEFSRFGLCSSGDDCTYLHISPTSELRRPACPHYTRGFCPLGPHCAMRHVKHHKICPYYVAGFCPNGRAHPPGQDKVVSCEHGAHARWIKDEDLHPRKPEPRTEQDVEQEAREQEQREQEFYEESERIFERNSRGGDAGGRAGFRGRGRGRGFRGRRY
jgi:cleavage and polyadenylation specificity factor subunit 4